jgi:hypothetical protein
MKKSIAFKVKRRFHCFNAHHWLLILVKCKEILHTKGDSTVSLKTPLIPSPAALPSPPPRHDMILESTWPPLQEIMTMWTPAYTPGDGQTSWVYSSNPVLLFNCQTSFVVPLIALTFTVATPIRLYPLHWTLYCCTLHTHSHVSSHQR